MSDDADIFALHPSPVWRERANFIVNAELPANDSPKRFEQLWTRQLDATEFEVCCIPFFVYDLALGDVVRTSPRGSRRYVFDEVLRPSGRHTFRVWFGEKPSASRDEMLQQLEQLGSLIERSSQNMVAMDAVDDVQARLVANYLWELEKTGRIVYETGRTA